MFCLTKESNLFIFMIFGKLTFQCTRNGHKNLPHCPGSILDTFIIYSSISHQHNFPKYSISKKLKTNIPKTPDQYPKNLGPSPKKTQINIQKVETDKSIYPTAPPRA